MKILNTPVVVTTTATIVIIFMRTITNMGDLLELTFSLRH